jgi:dissimilatory sulfite reductase (desulfoviridin) alpha/beta subunit
MSNPKTERGYTMRISQAAKIWIDYHVTNSLIKYREKYGDGEKYGDSVAFVRN